MELFLLILFGSSLAILVACLAMLMNEKEGKHPWKKGLPPCPPHDWEHDDHGYICVKCRQRPNYIPRD